MSKKALGKGLPNHIKEREMKTEFAKIIDAWRTEGYNVTRLDGILELDIDSISQAFTLFDNDVRNLRDIAEIITMMETDGFESEVESIGSKLKDPDQTTDVLQEVHDLDQKIKTTRDTAAKAHTAKKVDEWSSTLDEGKSELMDLWEKSEQEAMVKDPSALQDKPEDKGDGTSDDELENRLTNIRARLNKLSLDKTIPLRSDKIDMSDETAANAKPEPVVPAGEPEAPAGEQEAPAGEPEAPAGEPEAPAGEPEAPAGEPEAPAGEPEAPAGEPEAPAGEPEAPAGEPEAPAGEQEAESREPEVAPAPEAPETIEEPPQEPPTEPETPDVPGPAETQAPAEPKPEETQLTDSQKDDLNEALTIAKDMYRKQEYEKAMEYFDMALEIDPLNSDAIFFKKRAESRMN